MTLFIAAFTALSLSVASFTPPPSPPAPSAASAVMWRPFMYICHAGQDDNACQTVGGRTVYPTVRECFNRAGEAAAALVASDNQVRNVLVTCMPVATV